MIRARQHLEADVLQFSPEYEDACCSARGSFSKASLLGPMGQEAKKGVGMPSAIDPILFCDHCRSTISEQSREALALYLGSSIWRDFCRFACLRRWSMGQLENTSLRDLARLRR